MLDRIFGWGVKEKEQKVDVNSVPVVPEIIDDGSHVVDGSFYNAYTLNYEQTILEERQLILTYRAVARYPEADRAINNIVDEAIVLDDDEPPVKIILDKLNLDEGIKIKISNEFDYLLTLLDFNNEADTLFRNFYIDGRMYYNVIIDRKEPKKGIVELRRMEAIDTKKVREEKKERNSAGIEVTTNVEEYFAFSPSINMPGIRRSYTTGSFYGQTFKLSEESVVFIHSGIYDNTRNLVLSHLDKAIRPINQLRMMENAAVIYRLVRAPERRAIYVDTGNMPRVKAEQYIKSLMNKYKNKMTYDIVSGAVKDTTNTLSMLEDWWLPRREGGKTTEIQTLAGGQNLGEIEDILYFKKLALDALNVPLSRTETDTTVGFGRPSEITRDELAFAKFIQKLRRRFSGLFYELLKRQLLLKGVIIEADWPAMRDAIYFDYNKDNHFYEFKESEIFRERLATLDAANPYVGLYFSVEQLRKDVLKQTDDDIKIIDAQNKKDKAASVLEPESMPFNPQIVQSDPFVPDEEGDNPFPPKAKAKDTAVPKPNKSK